MKKSKNRGITLVALVVTIVILIIIASISIKVFLGDNGIIAKAKITREETNKQTAVEKINFKITNVQISKYAEKQRMPTLKELADNFCEDNDFQYVKETSELASLTKISSDNPQKIYTKLKAYPYEFEINSSLQLASIDGIKFSNNSQDSSIYKGYPISISDIVETDLKQSFDYTNNYQKYIVPEDGYYKIECWGAQGASVGKAIGGKGAYTKGIIYLNKDEIIWIYIGEKGKEGTSNGISGIGGYNGGGSTNAGNQWGYYGAGGGATDIRLVGGEDYTWDNFNSLKSRIMVAAGGGGGAMVDFSGWKAANGGAGGDFTGIAGIKVVSSSATENSWTSGGTQISGGTTSNSNNICKGKFGFGGNSLNAGNGRSRRKWILRRRCIPFNRI